MNLPEILDDVSIILSGEAGQGIQTIEQLLMRSFKLSGYNVFATKEYMSRIRGGNNSTEIRVSSNRVLACLKRIDFFIPMNTGAMARFGERITDKTVIIGDKKFIDKRYLTGNYNVIDLPISKLLLEIGSKIYSNIITFGILVNLFDIDINNTITLIKKFFSDQSDEVINKNIEAVKIGYDTSKNILGPVKDSINIRKSDKVKNEILMNGTDSIGLGAIAGGCNFIASYPMSPSTGTLIFLANHAKEFEIIVEQAEDEISAINMGLGAWYAGARAMVTTSGGGFDLMVEALSLAGCIESPMVIHLAQRPGPATGLPTRTEQGDLDIALYSGHGEFPRIIFAPRGIEDGFYLTQKAFNITDKYHVPVIILTDQYFLDSYYNISEIDISNIRIERYIIKTAKNYKRYRITESGISPRGIPGYGEGYVKVDSDEHNEYGNITEDFIMRENMVNKRLRKMEQIKKEINPPIFIGRENYKHIVVGWGSTYNVIKEALEILGRDDIAFLHFNHIYPFSDGTRDLLIKADKKVIIENNATSQFGKLVKIFTGVDFNEKILKYNGLPFMLEEVVDSLDKIF